MKKYIEPPTEQKALEIVKRKNLTNGQKSLYELVIKKLEDNEPILFLEAKDIYLQKVCQNMIKGVPHTRAYFEEKYIKDNGEEGSRIVEKMYPMWEGELTNRVLMWLTGNIGTLVLKGYLKVIPTIDVKNLK